jgi:hypothetical protein
MTKTSRKHKYVGMLPLWILFILCEAITAEAATYYVATTGNDAHVCTTAQKITTPKRTIKSGITCLKPGDTLYIRSGTYAETINLGTKTGTAGSYIKIASYSGEKVTIQPTGYALPPRSFVYEVYEGLILDGARAPNKYSNHVVSPSHHVIFRNLEIKNWKGNGFLVGANDVQILNCKIHHQVSVDSNRWYGIYFHHGANGVIEGNEIYNNPGGGIQAYPGTISNLIIRRNRIYYNNTMTTSNVGGIIVYRGSGVSISGVQISNNVLYKNSTYGGTSAGIQVNGPAGTKIWNNTLYGNKGWGIIISNNATTDTIVQNNIAFANTSGQISNSGTRTILNANLTTDPRFVNATASDFNLQLSSSAIDKGVLLSLVKVDIRNYPRPKRLGQDIGAYEVQ